MTTTVRMLIFLLVTSAVWGAAHFYVGSRLIRPLPLSPTAKRWAWVALWLLFSIGPLTMVSGRALGTTRIFSALRWVSFTYMGFFVVLFFAMLLRDAVGLVVAWMRLGPSDPERRLFLTNAVHSGVVGLSGFWAGFGLYEARRLATVVEVDVPIDDLPDELVGYQIAQASDIHVGPTIKGSYLQAVVDRINELGADMVAITGDLVDGYVRDLKHEVAALASLKATDGVFFVTGNHEYYWDAPEWVAELRRLGLTVLMNEHRVIERGGSRLLVAGCTDYSAGRMIPGHASDPARARAGAPECNASVLLAHQPGSSTKAAEAKYDLQLSGHTHGGQFFPITLFVGFAHAFVAGLNRLERTWVYVNRGTGYWGPPLRAGVPSEITLLKLVRA